MFQIRITKIKKIWSTSKDIVRAVFQVVFPLRAVHVSKDSTLQNYFLNFPSAPNTYGNSQYFMKYKDKSTKQVLWQFKYYLNPAALRLYTYILYDELVSTTTDRIRDIPFQKPHILVHCPSSTFFKGAKGFDHMKELLLKVDDLQSSESPFFECCTHAILPVMCIEKAQHMGTRAERIEWAKKRFYISEIFEKFLMEQISDNLERKIHCQIYCVDDVITTGASLEAISDLFERKFNLKIKNFCLCH